MNKMVELQDKPVVRELVDPWDRGEMRLELLGEWTTVPLGFGDGCVILTKDKRHVIASFSDYTTAQVLASLHNASLAALKGKSG